MPAPPMVLLFGAGAAALLARKRFARAKAGAEG
ncbi:PEP-CTERM sorting domain-containing protein [Sphingobium indicum]|uniref:PEP-CTERM sorting domain-containing protein n=1 Tax=Sphingobium indicum TaxID=332055 RepID=A0A4Q4JCI5_9SPHN|nr:PEP-CTERM sorting domain-containing protein [Sphingobium indicum]NYI24525.1 hypothetical protein [Sphingobium indicum]RYM04179.1 PEP-CTERM sorting domain-containing protein [Sphingobium indicum]